MEDEFVVEPASFTVDGEQLKGALHRSASWRGKALPGVIVTGAWMTIKEQMPRNYALALAQRGFAALTFDHRGWGESEGSPRFLECPSKKVEDIGAAARYLAARRDISGEAVGGLSVCASAGYMAFAAAANPEIGAVAAVAPWLHDADILKAVYGGSSAVQELVERGRAAQAMWQQGGQALVAAASLTDPSAVMYGAPYYTDPDRGLVPQWANKVDLAFWEDWLGFNPMPVAAGFRTPWLMVHSEAAAIPEGARQFYDSLPVGLPKSEIWLDDVSQFDFYDQPVPLEIAADAAAEHFKYHL